MLIDKYFYTKCLLDDAVPEFQDISLAAQISTDNLQITYKFAHLLLH